MKILQKTCLVCNHLFTKPMNESLNSWRYRRKYCSKRCANSAPRSQETRLKQRLAKLGKPSWNQGIALTEAHKRALRKPHKKIQDTSNMCGRRPWNKIGNGITPINDRIRKSPQYKKWRKSVYERDDYTCVLCGKHGGDFQADHIKPFSSYPSLRFEISNGRTLCKKCHRKTETYGMNQYTMKVQ